MSDVKYYKISKSYELVKRQIDYWKSNRLSSLHHNIVVFEEYSFIKVDSNQLTAPTFKTPAFEEISEEEYNIMKECSLLK